jgi:hypothetical protein
MFGGSLRVSPNVRMNRVMRPKMELIGPDSMPLGILAQASWRANRRKRPRVIRLPWRDAHMVVPPPYRRPTEVSSPRLSRHRRKSRNSASRCS